MSRRAHVRTLAGTDLRRMLRKHTDRSGGLGTILSTSVFVLLAAIATLASGYGASWVGSNLVSGNLDDFTANAVVAGRGLVAVFGLVLTVVVAVRAVGQRGTLTNAEGVLTMVPTREALLGVLLAESIFVSLWLAGPALGVGIGLAIGTGTPWPALTVPLATLLIGVAAVVVGYPAGLGLRHVVTRFPFVARHKGLLIGLVFLLYFVFVMTGSLNAAIVALFEPLQQSPTGWLADLLLLGVPLVEVSVLRAGGAVGVVALLTAVGVVAGTAFAEIHWFSDPALAGEPESAPSAAPATPGVERTLARYVSAPTAALVALAWRRARRAPYKLLYAAYPLFFAVGGVADVLQTGQVPAYLPVVAVLFVTWAAGVIFTLNPLGDQGAGLPTTLLSRVDGTRFVRAHLLASLLIVVPAGTLLTFVTALVSPLDTTSTVIVVLAAPVLMVVASALSVGIGVAFPRFEAVNITRSVKTVIPSLLAFALFSLHLVATTVSAAIVYDAGIRAVGAGLLDWLLPLSVDAEVLYIVAVLLLVVLVLAPIASYRYAVRTFDSYTIA